MSGRQASRLSGVAVGLALCGVAVVASSDTAPARAATMPPAARLLNGPVLFRLPAPDDDARKYAIAFRLDRDPVGSLDKTDDPVEGPFQKSRGEFLIGVADASIAVLRLPKTVGRYCFVAYAQDVVPDDNGDVITKLDRIRAGRHVPVTIQPAVPNGVAGGVELGRRTYTRKPVLRRSTSISLRASRDQRVLRSIHCARRN